MRAEILSIGDELTCGKILDTNAQWLSRNLEDLGIHVLYHTTVGDDLEANIDVFKIAASRADVIIATGGLGPTADDLTREAIAGALEVPLVQNEAAFEQIRAIFAQWKREMPARNEKQAEFPEGATPIRNPNGTAPGIDITVARKDGSNAAGKRLPSYRIIALPGVPAEMREMWNETVRDALETYCQSISGQKRVIRFRTIHCFGEGESQIERMLPDLINRSHFPTVGITADRATITLRIQSEAASERECLEQIDPVAKIIYEKLGSLVFGEGEETLADVVGKILRREGKTLSVMEWGTRGRLSEALGSSEETRGRFLGGLVVRSAEALRKTIRYSSELAGSQEIPAEFSDATLDEHPDWNEQVAALLARHALKMFESDYSLAVGPYPNQRVGALPVFLALGKIEQGVPRIRTQAFPFGGHPAIIDELYLKRALNLLRLAER